MADSAAAAAAKREAAAAATEAATATAETPAAPAPAAPAEGSVIAVHSLEQWSLLIEEANSAKKLVVIDFTATWCGPCRIMAPIFAELAKKHPSAVFLKVDVDEMKTIAEQFNVEAMPTFLFMKEGDVKDRVVGANKPELSNKIALHVAAQ